MPKAMYTEVNGKARKVKKVYVGVDNKARKVKKVYIGVAGKARLCFSSEQKLSNYGTATPLSVSRGGLSATTVGNYALFGGGIIFRSDWTQTSYNTVDAYNTSLTRTTATPLSVNRQQLSSTTVGNYALFGGGAFGLNDKKNTVDAYNTSLTRTTPTPLSVARYGLSATTVGNYALIGGGSSSTTVYSNTVDVYNTSLTRTTATPLSVSRQLLSATTVGNYALFGGGDIFRSDWTRTYYNTVDAYNTSLTRTTPTPLSVARGNFAATTVGNYALFGGGVTSAPTYYNTVDVYQVV